MSKNELRKIVNKMNSSCSQDSYYNLIEEYNTLLESMIDNGFKEELDQDTWIDVLVITPKYLDVWYLILKEEAEKTPLIFETLSESTHIFHVKVISSTFSGPSHHLVLSILANYTNKKQYQQIQTTNYRPSYHLKKNEEAIIFGKEMDQCLNDDKYFFRCKCPIVNTNDAKYVVSLHNFRFWPHELEITKVHHDSEQRSAVDLKQLKNFLQTMGKRHM